MSIYGCIQKTGHISQHVRCNCFCFDSWLNYKLVGKLLSSYPYGLEYLRTISFIVIIAAVVQFTEMVMEKNYPYLYRVLGIFLPLITTNCAVLGIPLLNAQLSHNLLEAALFGLGGALGFSLVLILFASLREKFEGADTPELMQGSASCNADRRFDEFIVYGIYRA